MTKKITTEKLEKGSPLLADADEMLRQFLDAACSKGGAFENDPQNALCMMLSRTASLVGFFQSEAGRLETEADIETFVKLFVGNAEAAINAHSKLDVSIVNTQTVHAFKEHNNKEQYHAIF